MNKVTTAIAIIIISMVAIVALYPLQNSRTASQGYPPPYCEYGDVNGDGVIDGHDVYGEDDLPADATWDWIERGDVNNNGVYDSDDAGLIAFYWFDYIDTFPVANRSSSAYQYDMIPVIQSVHYEPQNVNVGDTLRFSWVANDSNGEILKTYTEIKKGDSTVYKSDIFTIHPGESKTITYRITSPGEYRIISYVTYKYRESAWLNNDGVTINVGGGSPSNNSLTADFKFVVNGNTVLFFDN